MSSDIENPEAGEPRASLNFVQQFVREDLASGRFGDRIVTRFPPEPNGFLHIGHAKAICLNFALAEMHPEGRTHLRFDDTNPTKEEQRYIDAIQRDIRWLGFDWGEHLYFTSSYFGQLYDWAVKLIETGHAFVCDLSGEEMREYRGTLTEPGRESPCRDREVEENLDLFGRMRGGEFPDGAKTLRAKIDMTSGNINLRDPVLYRIMRATHHRTGDAWCIYPMYDFAHGQSDSIEEITHSICTLEFEDHRPLYDWFLDALDVYHPRQIEFARLRLSHTVMSKRHLLALVDDGIVDGWDDPRMPTLSGMRRRGYSPESLRDFCQRIGVAKQKSLVDFGTLELAVRDDLNRRALRFSAVLDPLKVVIENFPAGEVDELDATNNPEDESAGTRKVPFSRELWIERADFMEDPPKKFFRLGPGREVRLRYGYFLRCQEFVKDPQTGVITELRCTYDPETRGGSSPDGRKVKGTIHWVSAAHAISATVRIYEHLFEDPTPGEGGEDVRASLNPDSVKTLENCRVEPGLANAQAGQYYQFERQGYFCVDARDSSPERLVFNRTVSLRDTWAKIQKKAAQGGGGKGGKGGSGKG